MILANVILSTGEKGFRLRAQSSQIELEKKMHIARIKIRNFRSLVSVDLEFGAYNVLVGQNDSGKSNVLRALNLFFNGQTDVGVPLNFDRDFSQQAKTAKRKAKEISVEVEFSPPTNYTDFDAVLWKKSWRAGSQIPNSDELKRKSGDQFSARSRTEYWVRQVAFEYVPAIRGQEFFSTLKRRLHSTLAETIAPKLNAASGSFLKDIRKEVKRIESDAFEKLALKTEFALPVDLGGLFEALDFEAQDKHAKTSLKQRGDGIQGRHVPIILSFLAEQRKRILLKGRPVAETIWGYEEPENNLELSQQIIEADQFVKMSNSIQLLVTSHSPAFYSKANSGDVWFARRDMGVTEFSNGVLKADIDSSLGLMPFLAPYIAQATADRDSILAQLSTIKAEAIVRDEPLVLVEGQTDKLIIEKAWEILGWEAQNLKVQTGPAGKSGANWVAGHALARGALTELRVKTLAILDDDAAGHAARKRIQTGLEAMNRRERVAVWMIRPKCVSDELKEISSKGIKVNVGVEEMMGVAAWKFAHDQCWFEQRTSLAIDNSSLCTMHETLDQVLTTKFGADAEIRLITDNKIAKAKKWNLRDMSLMKWSAPNKCHPRYRTC